MENFFTEKHRIYMVEMAMLCGQKEELQKKLSEILTAPCKFCNYECDNIHQELYMVSTGLELKGITKKKTLYANGIDSNEINMTIVCEQIKELQEKLTKLTNISCKKHKKMQKISQFNYFN